MRELVTRSVVHGVYWNIWRIIREVDTDTEGRKHGEQSGLETHVVHAVNDAHSLGS